METKLVKFHNWTSEDFTGMWNSKPEYFKAGESKFMEEWRANHYATHLTNRELLRRGYENDTSPKFPDKNARFMEYFKKAYIPVEGEAKSDEEVRNEAINRNLNEELKPEVKEDNTRFCDECDSKGFKHKKECPKTKKAEKEFEDLD